MVYPNSIEIIINSKNFLIPAIVKSGRLTVRKPLTEHSLSLIILVNTLTGSPSAIIEFLEWMKTQSLSQLKITTMMESGKS